MAKQKRIDEALENEFVAFDSSLEEREFVYRAWCREHGFSYSVYQVLSRLMHVESESPSELADNLSILRQTMTGILDSLEAGGLVIRDLDPVDRRKKMVQITQEGVDYVNDVMGSLHDQELAAYLSLTPTERQEVSSIMRKYVDALKADIG